MEENKIYNINDVINYVNNRNECEFYNTFNSYNNLYSNSLYNEF